MTGCLLLEDVDEGCLAYACFARYEDYLSLATQGCLQIAMEPGKVSLTPNRRVPR
jgi:hypothetical protein